MEENKFALSIEQLKDIALSLQARIHEGLRENGKEIAAIPTFIQPKTDGVKGTAMVLDLGGTNYRVATVKLTPGEAPDIDPKDGWKRNLEKIKKGGYTEKDLLEDMSDPILASKRDKEMPIGYCFSYPGESMLNGDARLSIWTKGVKIESMVGKPVGKPLMDYLNEKRGNTPKFTGIKVINDTVASLFAGLTNPGYDAYIGLIVGTGTNMAAMMPASGIPKIADVKGIDFSKELPVNLESGNFNPPYLTPIDTIVDALSDSKGRQRFEKAISGFYLGEILKASNPWDRFEEGFNAKSLSDMMNYSDMYKEKFVVMAHQIYERSAVLVSASLAGLILQLVQMNKKPIRRILITSDGSLYWSRRNNGKDYNVIVIETLQSLLKELGLTEITVSVNSMENVNLVGSAIAALS